LVEDVHPKRVNVHWGWDIDGGGDVWCTADNDIGDEGAIRIAEGLEKNTSLKKLDLFGVFPPPSFFIHCCTSQSFIS
jgi:hypothetical protein